ncbi:hypothetical protein WG66_000283 [Moniliophthora roreri]|nr:hypothetical protein WG66_000283 [Moniliophthora roreri]
MPLTGRPKMFHSVPYRSCAAPVRASVVVHGRISTENIFDILPGIMQVPRNFGKSSARPGLLASFQLAAERGYPLTCNVKPRSPTLTLPNV